MGSTRKKMRDPRILKQVFPINQNKHVGEQQRNRTTFEVLTPANIRVDFLWVATPCSVAEEGGSMDL
jgi:hypothetical protein